MTKDSIDRIEKHPFIFSDDQDTKEGYFMPSKATKLILGTFPCFSKKNENPYGEWFYSASGRNSFWEIMFKIFSRESNKKTKEEMKDLLIDKGIAITDIFYNIRRKEDKNYCADKNIEADEYNKDGILKCIKKLSDNCKGEAVKVYCTSQFVKECVSNNIFEGEGVKVELVLLISPSPAIVQFKSLPKEYKKEFKEFKEEFKKEDNAVAAFRLKKYKEAFEISD